LTYVAITRASERLIWVVRNRLAKPEQPLQTADLAPEKVPLMLTPEGEET
ncbi:MAG: ATPase, partial [Pseudomonadota bacterium]